RVLRGVTEDVDSVVEPVEQDAVGPEAGVDRYRLEQLQGLRVEHRDGRPAARESVARLRVDGRAVSLRVGRREDFANRIEVVEIEDGNPRGDSRPRGRRVSRRNGTHGTARDV